MSSVLLYNHSGCENRGCEAIVRSTSALFHAAGAKVVLSSKQAEYDRQLNLPDVARVDSCVISPYSVSRLVNSIGFRLGVPREHEVARRYSPVIRGGQSLRCEPVYRRGHLLLRTAGAYDRHQQPACGCGETDCALGLFG